MRSSRRHILLVEDHHEVRAAFTALFADLYDYALHVTTNARAALGLTGRQDVDLAVVDLTQTTDAKARLAMIRSWRRDGLGFPVIATSAHDYDGLSVEALEAGADDFLRKPYVFGEMHARIQRQLIRHLNVVPKRTRIDGVVLPEEPFAFAGATITPDLRITFPDERYFKLSPKQLGMLKEFAAHAGTLLLKEKLIHAVWGPDANTNSASVHQYLYVIRKLYRASGVDLNRYVTPESKVGWRIARGATESLTKHAP